MVRIVLLATALFAGLGIGTAWGQPPRRPNIIIIFADDLGYSDIGAFGSPNNRTPRLDAMAAEGQKWTSFYVQPVCSPSRAAQLNRAAADPQRDVRQSGWNGTQGLPRQCGRGIATRGSHTCRAPEISRLPTCG